MRRSLVTLVVAATWLCAAVAQAQSQDVEIPSAPSSLTHWHAPNLNLNPVQPPPVPLTTLLGSVELSIDKTEVLLGKLHGLILSVRNGTDQPLVVDADLATATVGGVTYKSALRPGVDLAATPQERPAARVAGGIAGVVLGATTVGGYQLLRDSYIQHGPVLKRYGADQQRRTAEAEDFGRRVIWPGQARKGVVYFPAQSLGGAALTIPMKELFDPTNGASLSGHL